MQLDAAVQNAGVGLSQPLQRRPVPARWIHSPEGPVLLRQRLSTDRTSAATGGSRWQPGTRAGGGPTSNGRFGRDMANDDAPSAGLDQVGGIWTIPMPILDPCGGEAASLDYSLTGGKLDRATDRAGLLLKRHQAGRGDSLRHGRYWGRHDPINWNRDDPLNFDHDWLAWGCQADREATGEGSADRKDANNDNDDSTNLRFSPRGSGSL